MEKKAKCTITGTEYPMSQLIDVRSIRPQLRELIKKTYPAWSSEDGMISHAILDTFRNKYIQNLLEDEKGELNHLELGVMKSLQNQELISAKLEQDSLEAISFSQRIADKMALFGGSWRFIIIFGLTIVVWISVNSILLLNKPFDPFPFILLNLILSCLAAIQAPVIMMSQNRQEAKDRSRSQNDYQINLKAEIEIRQLHEKIDHIIINQSQRLFELQQIQIDLMEQLLKKK